MADANAWIDTVIARAKELRASGVTTIAVDGCSVTLAPAEADESDGNGNGADFEPDADPLNSPATYADGRVPGFTRES